MEGSAGGHILANPSNRRDGHSTIYLYKYSTAKEGFYFLREKDIWEERNTKRKCCKCCKVVGGTEFEMHQ